MRGQRQSGIAIMIALWIVLGAACSAPPGAVTTGHPAAQTTAAAIAGPKDVPLFVPSSNVTATDQELNFSTTADVTAVANYYAVEMPKLGWSNVADPYVDDTVAKLSFTKNGKNADIGIAIDAKSKLTVIGIVVQ
jgi:hypothetical protein